MQKVKYGFEDLLKIMAILRGENGCPWDKEQNHQTLKQYLIEETYEVLDAIDLKDNSKIVEELGDLLLQIVFHAEIGSENKTFDINDIINGICSKMINRHPHIFGNVNITTSEQVLKNWEEIKKVEKGATSQTEIIKNVPQSLPALIRSYKVQDKAADIGFDWNNIEDVFKKIDEEVTELKDAYHSKSMEKITEELGDTIFAVVNLARFLKIHPELALTGTINKFIKRFEYIEKESIKAGKALKDMSLIEMDKLWDEAKIILQ